MTWIAAVVFLALGPQSDSDYVQFDSKRVEKFRRILDKTPDDPEASTQVGRHLCFIRGEWEEGLQLLAKGKDKTLSDMAQFELGAAVEGKNETLLTGATFDFGEQVAPDLVRGDALWDLTKRYKDLEFRNIMNRVLYHYRLALSKVDDAKKKKLLERMSKVVDRFKSMYTHPGKVLEGPPTGWGVVVSKTEKIEGVATDQTKSHTGRASLRVTPARAGLLVTERKPIFPGDYTLSFWYLPEGTVSQDPFAIWLFDKADSPKIIRPQMPADRGELPVWIHVELKVKVDAESLGYRLYIDNVGMREGSLWIDDLSFRGGPKNEELAPNGGFEER
jgi:hypothetical protein